MGKTCLRLELLPLLLVGQRGEAGEGPGEEAVLGLDGGVHLVDGRVERVVLGPALHVLGDRVVLLQRQAAHLR